MLQVKIKSRLILNSLCLLALIIHHKLGLEDKKIENQPTRLKNFNLNLMFTSANYEKHMYMCIPFLVIFCTCHKTVKVSDDDIDHVGVYV